jgi:hypothetical protein
LLLLLCTLQRTQKTKAPTSPRSPSRIMAVRVPPCTAPIARTAPRDSERDSRSRLLTLPVRLFQRRDLSPRV